jgi:hypothetical protein
MIVETYTDRKTGLNIFKTNVTFRVSGSQTFWTFVGSGSVHEYLMITGEVGVEVNHDAALVVLCHGTEQFRTVHLLVARGQTSPVQT